MNRPRDRASAAGLLPRMEARPHRDGRTVSYRYHPIGAKPIPLGTDRLEACRKVAVTRLGDRIRVGGTAERFEPDDDGIVPTGWEAMLVSRVRSRFRADP